MPSSSQIFIARPRPPRVRIDPVAHALRGIAAAIEQELSSLPENARPKEIQIDLMPDTPAFAYLRHSRYKK